MKKSKFLKSSKDMLSRSFNPSKCKTSLRLAGSRLKLLRNKKEVQVKQMKREISQLLESGQDQTARIRVEHVIREEKMMAAYDLISLYCELIVARLPIIETQKICPIDLKEAITSVIFASPRCGDVPELKDAKKQFTDKYGKDFITAAVELRPDCGVSRLLVEKLSAVAPDGPTKIKILTAIAEEHNVKWDPKSFGENSLPENNLLNGPSNIHEDSKLHVEPANFGSSVNQVPQSTYRVHDSQSNFTQVDNRNSPGAERLASSKITGINTSFQHNARPPALGDEREQLVQGHGHTVSLDRHGWNMEFKDATSAAQAAAESAERASMAARAAAELSKQHSTASHNSDASVSNDRGRESYMNSRFSGGQSEDFINRSFSEQTRSQNEQIERMKPNNLKIGGRFKDIGVDGSKEHNQSASLKSKASRDNETLHDDPVLDGYSRKNSLKDVFRGGTSMQKVSYDHKSESADDWQENSENVRDERIGKQPSVRSSNSHSGIYNDVNIFSNSKDQKYEYGSGEDSFLGSGKKDLNRESSLTDSHESAGIVFDKSESDSENQEFDMSSTYDEPKHRLHVPLSEQKHHERLSKNMDSWSPRSSTSTAVKSSSSLFHTRKSSSTDSSERSIDDSSKLNDLVSVKFDRSDESTSESEEDMNISRHSRISRDFLSTQNLSAGPQFRGKNVPSVWSSLKEKRSPQYDLKQSSPYFDDGPHSENMDRESNREKKFGDGNSTPESEGQLNFEKLTGGFRHKGFSLPSYLKNRVEVSSSFKKESEDTTAVVPKSSSPPAVESPRLQAKIEHKKSRKPYLQSSDSDSSDEEQSAHQKQGRYTPTVREDIKTKPNLRASNSICGSDNSDSDEDRPKESSNRYSHLRSGISRRTKAIPSTSGKLDYSMASLRSETLGSDDIMDRKATTSTNSETAKSSESQRKTSKMEVSEQHISRKVASKPTNASFRGTQDQHSSGKANPVTKRDFNFTRDSSSVEESSFKKNETGESMSRENPKVATLEKTSSNKGASHVHPKLPDYDDILQFFQKNRS